MTISSFKHLGCFDFCVMVQRVQSHLVLTRVFISNLEDNQVTLAGVTFTISSGIIVAATGIPNVHERWFKAQNLDNQYYEPYFKPRYINERKKVFPFSHLLDTYAPMMTIIMKYFTCEGRFSRLYTYHIRLFMHFTRFKMLNIPYYFFGSIRKMAYTVQGKTYEKKMNSLSYHSLVKIIVLHHLNQLNISWDTFIANNIFIAPQAPHVEDMPSSSHPIDHQDEDIPPPSEPTTSIPPLSQPLSPSSSPLYDHTRSPSRVDIIKPKRKYLGTLSCAYQICHRQVFSPKIMGGALPCSLTKQVENGKQTITYVEIQQHEEDLYETEHDFELVDLSEWDDYDHISIALKGKDAKIGELQTNIDRAIFFH